MYGGPGANFMGQALLTGINGRSSRRGKRGAKNKSIPYHGRRRHMNISVMGEGKCNHALSQHQDLNDKNGRPVTISFALPCQVQHKATTKRPTHKDVDGRKW